MKEDPCPSKRAQPARPGTCGAQARHDWREGLPPDWLAQVVQPVFFSRHRDYEIEAERVIGYEVEDEPCYCSYRVVLTELRSDDDETWFMQPVHAERLTGWRLVDARWLILRQISQGEDCLGVQAFFSFSGEMPR